MIRLSHILLSCALLAWVAGGCEGTPLTPSNVAGTYVLERVGDSPLPAVTVNTAYATFTVVADTLRLLPDRTGTETQVLRVELHGAATPPVVEPSRQPLGYRLRGNRIVISYGCASGEVCQLANMVGSATGYLTSDGLVMEMGPAPFVFRRVE
jgi:hypothetical protein